MGDDWICLESFACFPCCAGPGRPGHGWVWDLEVAEEVGMEHAVTGIVKRGFHKLRKNGDSSACQS